MKELELCYKALEKEIMKTTLLEKYLSQKIIQAKKEELAEVIKVIELLIEDGTAVDILDFLKNRYKGSKVF